MARPQKTRTHKRTDGQTDGQMDGAILIYPRIFFGGIKNTASYNPLQVNIGKI